MPTDMLHLVGAGGHGRVVLDALLLCPGWNEARIVVRDDRTDLAGTLLLGCRVEVPARPAQLHAGWVHVAIGDARLRKALLERSGLPPARWLTVCHPRGVVAASAVVAEGGFLAALALVGPCARIGKGVIANHAAVIDHDCQIGDFCHIGPNATLGGGVMVGRAVLVGAGATLLPGVRVGDGAIIGAGAVVLRDVPAHQTLAGVPAKNTTKGK